MADVVIRLTAVDGVSPVLIKISGVAKGVSGDLRKMGSDGKKGMDDISKGAKGADTAMRTVERTSLAVGAALGAVALVITKVSSAAAQQQRQMDAISRMYGENAQAAMQYAEQIQATTAISNDAARQSLILLNTLTQNYGISQQQIEQLVSRSADLAQLHGRTMQEVTQMVSNALRGEGEYIEQIGVTLNQSFVAAEAAARGMGNFISGMTAAEQAAFRFQLLMEQTANAQGYAIDRMSGMRGAVALLTNELGDAAQGFGNLLGPVRDVAAQFAPYALWMPLIASQFGRVVAMLTVASGRATIAANAIKVLGVATSGLGLGIGAAVVGLSYLGIKYLESKQAAAQLAAENKMLEDTYNSLNETISAIYTQGNRGFAEWAQVQLDDMEMFISSWDDLSQRIQDQQILNTAAISSNMLEYNRAAVEEQRKAREEFLSNMEIDSELEAQIIESYNRVIQAINNPNLDTAKVSAEFDVFWDGITEGLLNAEITPDQIPDLLAEFTAEVNKQIGDAQKEIQRNIDNLEFDFKIDDLINKGTSDRAIAQIENLRTMYLGVIDAQKNFLESSAHITDATMGGGIFGDQPDLRLSAANVDLITKSYERLSDAMESGDFDNAGILLAMQDLINLWRAGVIDQNQFAVAMGNLASDTSSFSLETDNAADSVRMLSKELGEAKRMSKEYGDDLKATAKDSADAFKDSANSFREAQQQMVTDFTSGYLSAFAMDDPLSKINLSSLRNEFTALAGEIGKAGSQLETVFRVIVGNTNAIAQQSQGIYDWAEALIGVAGQYAVIDDLLASGLITLDQYRGAQTAFNEIAVANERILASTQAIQAMQAPFIADFVSQQAEMLQQLRMQDEVQQRVTLGWMDSATAAQAYSLMTQAADVATGKFGETGAKAFHAMIEGAIAVNPFLFDMLETIGLISGTPLDFEVNLSGVSEGISEIERLTMSVDALTVALGGTPPDLPINVTGVEDVEAATEAVRELNSIGNKKLTMEVEMQVPEGFGSAGLQGALGRLGGGKPIEVPAIPVWAGGPGVGDGTGGAGLGALPEMEVAVTPVVDTSELDAAIPTGEQSGPTIVFHADTSEADSALGEWVGYGDIDGPRVMFDADDSAPQSALANWITENRLIGPMVEFGSDDSQPSSDLGEWVGYGTIQGPIVQFTPDTTQVSTAFEHWSGFGNTNGPVVVFTADDAAPNSTVGEWAGYGSFTGPIVVFTADSGAVDAALARYSGTSVIGTRIVNIVTKTQTIALGTIKHAHGGGINSFAGGGMVPFEAAENNRPEILHMANGGMALLRQNGIYMAQPGSVVTPSNAVRGMGYGDIHLSISGNTFYGGSRPDLSEWAANDLIPALAQEFDRDNQASGF